jgi:hypothetical protein
MGRVVVHLANDLRCGLKRFMPGGPLFYQPGCERHH